MQIGILRLIWNGFFTGLGLELSFFLLWVAWHFLHKRAAHLFDSDHIFHKIHEYFK